MNFKGKMEKPVACQGIIRLLKCFCGCSDMTVEEVEHIYRLSAQETLINRQASKMLRSFFALQRSGDKSEAEQYLDVYEKCDEYLKQTYEILTLDDVDELAELGLPYFLEKDLKTHIKSGNVQGCLLRIQGECGREIESSDEYRDYKQAVLQKLKQVK